MENYDKPNLTIVVINCLLALICGGSAIYVSFSNNMDVFYKIEAIADLLALLGASIYLVLGYKKGVASVFKTSMYICALHALLVTALAVNEEVKYIPVISCAISYGNIFLLALGKDLGKKMSYGLAITVVILRTLGFVSSIFSGLGLFNTYSVLVLSQLVLALFVLIIVYAKYTDKKSRGTK